MSKHEIPSWLVALESAIPNPPVEERIINGHKYEMRGMTAKEADTWTQEVIEFEGRGKTRFRMPDNMRAKLVARVLVSIDDVEIPTDRQSRSLLEEQLAKADARIVSELFEWAQKLSGLSDEAIEEAAGN